MKKIIKIKGMMCEHCEGKVRNELEKIAKVEKVSHDDGEAIIYDVTIKDEEIKHIIENLGFEVGQIINE